MHEESGAGLVEWGLVVILIAVVALGAVKGFGQEVSGLYGDSSVAIQEAGEPADS